MPILAVCISAACAFIAPLQDNVNGVSIAAPERCPDCGSAIITSCRGCGFPLLGPMGPERLICKVCGGDVREKKPPEAGRRPKNAVITLEADGVAPPNAASRLPDSHFRVLSVFSVTCCSF
jgi:hypothetical protein